MGLTFYQQMAAIAKKTGEAMEDHVVAARMQINKGIMMRNPVDTGRSRASWIATMDTPSKAVASEQDDYPSDNALLAKLNKKAAEKPIGIYWLTNNLPYIRGLEYGASTQAPEGMVRVTIEEFKIGMKELLK